ncbi:glutamate-rich protein 6-like isoform X2 [Siniperca chuatsi]|uniref:glutamate-rich protein 6-like isoform X2 n=1 Tax=Siniperca chuatsi TaxID=119488 RepID=UPI001CE2022A|nr:glutamate-rich protein 6-like isoform X2 [Siniperca chuatsi]
MSQSPSYQRDTSSPESPKEGDFSPRQLYDNPKSLEEHETCEDQKDPIVDIIPDNYFSSLLNTQICAPLATNDLGKLCAAMLPQEQPITKSHWREPRCFSTSPIKKKLPVSPEFIEVRTLDGRFITLVNTHTQTDWEWVEQSLSFSCQVQKEIEDPQVLQAEVVSMDTDSSETEDEEMPKEYDIPCVGPPRLIAYKPEPKQTHHAGKVPEVESKQDVHLAQCDYCQQLCQPFIQSELLENETDFERLFCCEQAKQMREVILEEKEKLAQKESGRKIDVNLHAPVMSERERETTQLQARKRLRHLQRKTKNENLNKELSLKNKTSVRQSKQIPYINDEPHIPRNNIRSTLQEETDGEPKEAIKKFYKSGKCFLTLYPDGTGNVFYPSGKAAIIISSAEADDFTYIILEDRDIAPSIKGIFTNKGHSTCYHPNGMIWLNLTPVGGLCLSETGAMKRRWNWLYFDPHVRNLPFQPLTFALGPHISVRIHSQERMYITFAHRQNSVRFSVGSKVKLIYPESHDKLWQDVLERYIQMKSSEIYSLLGQMQTCMSHHSANLSNIKPHYSFIAQTQRLSRQMEKEKSPEKIKEHVN